MLSHRSREDGHRVGGAASPPTTSRSWASTTGSSSPRPPGAQHRGCSKAWMRAGVTIVDPATTWVDVGRRARAGRRSSSPGTQLHGAHARRRGRRGRARTARSPTPSSARAPWCARRLRRRRDRRRTRRSARSPTCGRAPCSAPARKVGAFVEMKNARSATAPRCRTCPTSATPRSARAPTSAPPRSSSTTTASRSTAPMVGDHVRVGSDTMLVAPVTIGDGAYTAAGLGHHRRRPAGRDGGRPGPAAQHRRAGSRAGAREPPRRRRRSRAPAERRRHHRPSRAGRRSTARGAPNERQVKTTDEKKLMLFSGRAYPELAEEVAETSASSSRPPRSYDFANGEIFVRFEESVRGCDAFVHPEPHRADQQVDHGAADHGRRAQAGVGQADHRGRAVLRLRPAGQEAPRPRADLGPADGRPVQDRGRRPADAVDLHTSQIQGFFDGPVDHLFALPLLAPLRRRKGRPRDHHRRVARRRPGARRRALDRPARRRPLAIIHKRRDPDVPNEVKVIEVVGEVEGRICVLVDDMIDTGGTIVKAAEALFEQGAADVIVAATHGDLLRPGRRPAEEQPDLRGRRHQHAADPGREAVRQAHRAVDRPADRAGDPRGVRRRLGDQPVRRRQLTPATRRPAPRPPGARVAGDAGFRLLG